eukprot:Ihof_evm1s427 gene=Ihof_evmTU1s427
MFADDYTHFVTVYLMKSKPGVPQRFKAYKTTFETMHSTLKNAAPFTNQGEEYLPRRFQQYLHHEGITHMITLLYAILGNGLSKN